jgi:Patatin phospholipase
VALVAALYWALDRLLIEVEQRRKDISYSSRTRLNTDNYHQKHLLRRAIAGGGMCPPITNGPFGKPFARRNG